jgi:hypothetical protein
MFPHFDMMLKFSLILLLSKLSTSQLVVPNITRPKGIDLCFQKLIVVDLSTPTNDLIKSMTEYQNTGGVVYGMYGLPETLNQQRFILGSLI